MPKQKQQPEMAEKKKPEVAATPPPAQKPEVVAAPPPAEKPEVAAASPPAEKPEVAAGPKPEVAEKKGKPGKPCNWRHLSKARDGSRSTESFSKADYLECLASRDKNPNPLRTFPNISNGTMKPDRMHTCDEGIGALCAGQALKELPRHYPGSNQESKAKALWEHIVKIYDAQGCQLQRDQKI